MRIELVQQRAAKRRLARADLARELHKTLPLADAVEQMVERFAMLGTVEKKARVRRDVERRVFQPVMFQIHRRLLAETVPGGKEKVSRPITSNKRFPCRPNQGGRRRRRADRDAQII